MKLSELSALPKGTYKIIDRNHESHYPRKWSDIIHVLYKDQHKGIRRYNAFLSGLCLGSQDPFPTLPNRGGAYQNAGRPRVKDSEKKIPVKIGVEQSVVDSLGGLRAVQVILIEHLKSLI